MATAQRRSTRKTRSVKSSASNAPARTLPKAPTGIDGLDEITGGGLPRGRPTLVCGSAGCGKTLLSMEFLVRGAVEYGEPGAFIAFEETPEELAQNVRSLGFDLDALIARKKLAIDYIRVEPNEIQETGEFDLDGLFIRLALAIDTVNAKRVVLDTIETLFSGFRNQALLRAELRRLFRWLKDKGVTAIVTGERGEGQLTRQGLEEYVSDCVILLDHRVREQVSTRRLRIVKYRGSLHGTNEYPFLIDERGIAVLPITGLSLAHDASNERISTGIPALDEMLDGKGYYRGSSVLVSGTAGTGKTSIAAHFAKEICARGERCLYLAFEESPSQMIRNMRSIGVNLEPYRRNGTLTLHASRPSLLGLEAHLVQVHKYVTELEPTTVIVDPISNFVATGSAGDAEAMLLRLIDFLKARQITALFTHLTAGGHTLEATDIGVSSLIDTWLLLRDIELGGERNRGIYVIKSRGMAHSNQVREFLLTSRGVQLQEVYVGPEGVLTGSMRATHEAKERAELVARRQASELKQRDIDRRRAAARAQIEALRAELDAAEMEAALIASQDEARERTFVSERAAMAARRGGNKKLEGKRKS
ncbi:MAG TPA: circadian clock protein KaiC [Gammaproteobacteria bacterium]|nr:circadian clock protein KaiC [Gammaproteobacteria bacterium]